MHGYDEPTVIWRLTRGRSVAHATIIPGAGTTTVTWFFDGNMDRAENYDSVDLALARAEQIRGILERDGWKRAE
jgi:adenylate kinase